MQCPYRGGLQDCESQSAICLHGRVSPFSEIREAVGMAQSSGSALSSMALNSYVETSGGHENRESFWGKRKNVGPQGNGGNMQLVTGASSDMWPGYGKLFNNLFNSTGTCD